MRGLQRRLMTEAPGLMGGGPAFWFGLACIALGLAALFVMSLAGALTPSAPVTLLCGLVLGGAVTAAVARVMERRRERRCPWTALGDGMSAGLILIDADGRYVCANRAAERFLGLPADELRGRPVDAVMHALRMPLLLALDVLQHGSRPAITARLPMGGRTVAVEFSRSRRADDEQLGFAVILRDVTEEYEFSGNVMATEKMTALGELAAAMAHEINSPLGGVMESVRIIRKNAGRWDKVERFLPLVQQGLEQIAATVRQMLRLASPQEAPRAPLVLEELVTQCVDFLQYRVSDTGAELLLDLGTRRTVIKASGHMLSQVLLNLINNAFDAVAGRPGGAVTVRTALLPRSGEVEIEVADNGAGVPKHLRARIFEPFFTTKPSGKGTGLGLSISARIAARHGGRIIVSDNEDSGAVFRLILPLVGQEGEENDVSAK